MTRRSGGRPAATERVQQEWARRIEAEYRSAAITQELGHGLIVLGAPEWLVRDCNRIVADELVHARLSASVARAAGAREPPVLAQESLARAREPGEPIESAVLRAVVDGYCLGETVAVRLFSAMREGCDVPVARRALDRILRDEVRHRDFGWTALAWMLERFGDVAKAQVHRELPKLLGQQQDAYAPDGAAEERSLPSAERRWGLLPAARYLELLRQATRRDYAPRLERLGLPRPG